MYTTPGSNNNSSPLQSGNDRLAFDNLVRRELKIADPGNAQEVAEALLKRYKDDPRANAIQQEALGLPFLQAYTSTPVVQVVPTASDKEWQQAVDDTERDLRELTTNTLLKDVMPELTGWTQAIRSVLGEVEGSARFALDPRQRDKTLSLRRQLSDYARFARLVGVLTPDANAVYRQLGMSLDEAAAVAMVRVGEALANAGFSGNYLIQTPYAELQQRRDAVVYALRGLSGATQEAFAPGEWPRGLNAYRKLYEALEEQGQGELRSLLVENELSRVMDDIIQRAGNGTAEGLRAAGATAEMDMLRFRRLIATARNIVRPESPPLTTFLEALQLFADGFSPSGGSRLLRIARPPILLYGIYGSQGVGGSDARLLRLVSLRNQLADQLDCLDCGCDSGVLRAALDLGLHGVDRAIDLYAGGREDFGNSECRASAFAYVLMAILEHVSSNALRDVRELDKRGRAVKAAILAEFQNPRQRQAAQSRWRSTAQRISTLLRVMDASQCNGATSVASLDRVTKVLRQLIVVLAPFLDAAGLPPADWDTTQEQFLDDPFVQMRERELRLQRSIEKGWPALVASLAPGCAGDELIVGPAGVLESIVDRARCLNDKGAVLDTNLEFQVQAPAIIENPSSLPPDLATSSDGFINDIFNDGEGR
jgi:hypothetical protein